MPRRWAWGPSLRIERIPSAPPRELSSSGPASRWTWGPSLDFEKRLPLGVPQQPEPRSAGGRQAVALGGGQVLPAGGRAGRDFAGFRQPLLVGGGRPQELEEA